MNTYGSKIVGSRASSLLIDELLSQLRLAKSVFGVNLEQILSLVNEDYDTYRNNYSKEINKVALSNKNRSPEEAYENTIRFTAMLDNMWAIHNGNIFVMDIESALKLPDVTTLENTDLDAIADCYICFTTHNDSGKRVYLQNYISLLKDSEQISTTAHKNMDSFAITYGLAGNLGLTYQLRITKELFPRFLRMGDFDQCESCQRMNRIAYSFINKDSEETNEMHACLVGRAQRNDCKPFHETLTPQTAVNILAYATDMYLHRHSLIRKNSKKILEYDRQSHINVVCRQSIDNKDAEVPLLQYVKGEGSSYISRPGTQHSHHASPREHIRHEYTRTLKSGKVVKVKSSIVNKGKEKTVYKI